MRFYNLFRIRIYLMSKQIKSNQNVYFEKYIITRSIQKHDLTAIHLIKKRSILTCNSGLRSAVAGIKPIS